MTVERDGILLEQADRATIDFIRNVKGFAQQALAGKVAREYREEVARRQANGEPTPRTFDDVASIVSDKFEYQAEKFISRQVQEMMWTRLFSAVVPHERDLLRWLDEDVPNPIGSLRLAPNTRYPAYYEIDYHIQPGGMHKEALIPFVMEIGQVAYHGERNARSELKEGAALAIPPGNYQRILDMGCGIGHSTIPIKERFPNSEVYGIDLSAPFVRYAHRQAERRGLAIHYSQQNAERTDFPDNYFDVVTSCILFHEVPDDAAMAIIREGYRITKPGGLFQIADTPPYREHDLFRAFTSDWQTENNGEPYWRQAALRDADREEQIAILEASLQGACQVVVDITSRYLFEKTV
ncbi:MAG: methyltransferase domain-containing protein, partial [Dehalococcoidia bacterium]|nr:methyltransferase domain-containing protein [Dehalococcoidia bacterium]